MSTLGTSQVLIYGRGWFYDHYMHSLETNSLEPEMETTYDRHNAKQYKADLQLTQAFRAIVKERTAQQQREVALCQEAREQTYFETSSRRAGKGLRQRLLQPSSD